MQAPRTGRRFISGCASQPYANIFERENFFPEIHSDSNENTRDSLLIKLLVAGEPFSGGCETLGFFRSFSQKQCWR